MTGGFACVGIVPGGDHKQNAKSNAHPPIRIPRPVELLPVSARGCGVHAVQKLARVNVVAAQGGQLAHDAAQKGEGDAPLEHGHPRILLRPERGDGVAAGVALLAEGGERLEDAPREGGGGGPRLRATRSFAVTAVPVAVAAVFLLLLLPLFFLVL